MEKKEDKRVTKTKKAVKEAMIKLLSKKDFKQITITDIAEEAKINRATFYMHYSNTYEVISAIGTDISNAVISCLEKFDKNHFYQNSLDILYLLAQNLDGIAGMHAFADYSSSSFLLNKLKAKLIRSVYSRMTEIYPEADKGKLYCTVTFTIAGLMETYLLWYTDTEKKVSLHELASLMSVYLEQAYNFMSDAPKNLSSKTI